MLQDHYYLKGYQTHYDLPSYGIVPPVLSHIRVHYLKSARHVFFLSTKNTHQVRIDTTNIKNKSLNSFAVRLLTVQPMESATLLPSFSRDPYLLLGDADVILQFVSGIPPTKVTSRRNVILEVILIFKYLCHRLAAALGDVH